MFDKINPLAFLGILLMLAGCGSDSPGQKGYYEKGAETIKKTKLIQEEVLQRWKESGEFEQATNAANAARE